MKKLNILVLLLGIFVYSSIYCAEKNSGIPTQEQVQKLGAAAWKEPIKSIDITFYKDYWEVPRSVEELRKRAEEASDREFKQEGRPLDELKPYEIERRNIEIEANLQSLIENQKFPRKAKSWVRISGNNQRSDIVFAGPNESIGMDTPFVDTFINTKDANTGEFVSYHYASGMETVFVDITSGWAKETIIEFADMQKTIRIALQFILDIKQGNTPTSLNFVPDPNKISELAKTGLISTEIGVKTKETMVNRISISPDPDAPDTRDKIEIGPVDDFPGIVMICDKNNYSRVYRLETQNPAKNHLMFLRECSNFDSQGFPHNITETQWDEDGNFVKKSVYRVIKVELNPSIPDEVFELRPPEGYVVNDPRPPEKRPKDVNYLTSEDVDKILAQVDKAYHEKDLTALKEFLKHKSSKVRDSALGLITGVAQGEELKEIAESVLKEDKSEQVRKHAEGILEDFQNPEKQNIQE